MRKSQESFVNNYFSHIYIEEEARGYETTNRILDRFSDRRIISIGHYKDFFCKKGQDFSVQKKSPKLILAVNHGDIIYKGSKMCDAFGNENFHYTSQIMNCIYDCEYCYLQGLYPSANVVVFVNIEDTLKKASQMLAKDSLYLCISYGTDLLAFENYTGFCGRWIDFAGKNPHLKIELRTKAANFQAIKKYPAHHNFILAWTLSPQEIIHKFEHGTPTFANRLKNISDAIEVGYSGIRLCLDPALPTEPSHYEKMVEEIFNLISPEKILDVSLGNFRMPEKISKKGIRPGSEIFAQNFERDMTGFLKELFLNHLPPEKIFINSQASF